MKIKTLFITNKIKRLALAAFAVLSLSSNVHAQEGDPAIGEKLFNGKCASCHNPFRDVTGPALKGARERWIEKSTEENFYAWIKNSAKVIASGDPYAKEMSAFDASVMTPQTVSDKQIDDIFAYIEAAEEPKAGGDEVGTTSVVVEEEGSSTLYWWLFAGLLVVVIAVVGGVKGNLAALSREQDGQEPLPQQSVGRSARTWAWNNRGWFGVTVFVSVILLLAFGMVKWLDLGVYEDYKPEQPIAYSHELHAGELGIDCKYCHNAVTKSKHATIPSVNVCMNCHKTVVDGRSDEGTEEIAKIHKAAGYDPDTRTYTGETEPIQWVKVHNLPDHVYFNHSQHVVAGGIDCKQCHGNMKKQTVAKVMSTEDLNNVGVTDEDYDENKIKFTKPTLTMGWCIECHRESTVDIAGAPEGSYYNVIHERLLLDKRTYQEYLEDDVVTVGELGGLECAKCHY
ncbi:cytochrome c3 family protein [Crocinitomix algicola]|uniref:cytochrome c3 family protein n=1 Tax=Crocinitomix algicola TaxID=1740263 RepID=UPI000830B83D|nr:cytochrome c3 family protein [Crocinitomix algicola]